MWRDEILQVMEPVMSKFGFRYEGEFEGEVELIKGELVYFQDGVKDRQNVIVPVMFKDWVTGWRFVGESGIEVVCCARRLDGKEFSVWLVEGEGKRLRYWGKVVCEELDGKVVGARWE